MQIYNSQRHIYCSIRSLNWTKHHIFFLDFSSFVCNTNDCHFTLHPFRYTSFVNIAVELKCSTSLYGTMKCKFNSFHSINVSTFSIDFVLSKNRKKKWTTLEETKRKLHEISEQHMEMWIFLDMVTADVNGNICKMVKKFTWNEYRWKWRVFPREEYITVVLSWFHPGDELIMKFSDVIEINMNNNWCMNTRNLLEKNAPTSKNEHRHRRLHSRFHWVNCVWNMPSHRYRISTIHLMGSNLYYDGRNFTAKPKKSEHTGKKVLFIHFYACESI